MRLNPERLHRDFSRQQGFEQLQQLGTLDIVIALFDVHIVVNPDGIWIGFGRRLKGNIHILWPKEPQKGSIPQASFEQAFIHNVPGVQLARVVPGHCSDMVYEQVSGVALISVAVEPCRQGLMPYQGGSVHHNTVRLGPVNDPIPSIENKAIRRRAQGFPFHFAFGHDDLALSGDQVSIGMIGQQRSFADR